MRFKNFLSEVFVYRPTSVFPLGYIFVSICLFISFVPLLHSYKFFFMEYEDQKIIYLGYASKYSPERLRGGHLLNVEIDGREFLLGNSCPDLVKGSAADIYIFDELLMVGIVPIYELAYVTEGGGFICKNRRVDRDGFERVKSDKRAWIFLVAFAFFCYVGMIVTAWRAGPSKQSLAWTRKD